MNLENFLGTPKVELTAKFELRLTMDVPVIGWREILEIKLSGFHDEDGDLRPEFDIDVEVFDADVLPVSAKRIELDPALVVKSMGGGQDAIGALFEAIKVSLAASGVEAPW